MSASNRDTRMKKNSNKRILVNLYKSSYKTWAALCKEYGIAPMALTHWFKQYSTIETYDSNVLISKKVKDFQKRNSQLEE